jgi:hypothetical protein
LLFKPHKRNKEIGRVQYHALSLGTIHMCYSNERTMYQQNV